MRTAQEMDAYAREHGYLYGSEKTALKHFAVIEKNLLPGEDVIMALAPNSVYSGNDIVMGGITAVVFTNKRLMYGQKAILMGAPVKVVNLENVNDVHKDTLGLLNGKIYIDTLKENIGIQFTKAHLDRIFKDILQMLENYRATPKAPAASSGVSAADELKKFKELLDMGIITQEEFKAKKKQLLGL